MVIRGDASARCGISMKGVDIVVHGSVGHMSAFMAQKGRLVVCGDAGEALGDSIYEARLYVRGHGRRAWAPTASRRRCATSTSAELGELLERAGVEDAEPSRVPPLRLGAAALQLRRRQRAARTDDERDRARSPARLAARAARVGARSTATRSHEIQRAAREGIYDIRGFGAKRQVPHFDDLLFLGASMSRYPLEGYRERCDTDVTSARATPRQPLHLDIPITIAGMSFGALSAPAKEALGRGASAVGTSTTTGDGGMTPEEREHSKHARLPAAARRATA